MGWSKSDEFDRADYERDLRKHQEWPDEPHPVPAPQFAGHLRVIHLAETIERIGLCVALGGALILILILSVRL